MIKKIYLTFFKCHLRFKLIEKIEKKSNKKIKKNKLFFFRKSISSFPAHEYHVLPLAKPKFSQETNT